MLSVGFAAPLAAQDARGRLLVKHWDGPFPH